MTKRGFSYIISRYAYRGCCTPGSVYKEGAEHAAYLAQKTLSKVYRKRGFVAK